MKFALKAAAVALFAATIASASAAEEPYNTIGCLHMAKQVAGALSANAQSPNFKAASDEQKAGREYCMSGVYNIGIHHYEKALDLLGVGKS